SPFGSRLYYIITNFQTGTILGGHITITNIILNAIMIPLWGIKGAAAATLITQIFTNFIVPSFFKDIRIIVKYIIQAFLLKGVFRIK
ncbi:MAG: hypothetical protein GX242_01020, partial [Clostridiales bacterium]|nr:hypothetical protein [Clostridiales bacterium]